MKIGIDIDDTTFITVKSMLKYADKFELERTGKVNKDSFGMIKDRYYLKALYKWDDETKYAFFRKYYKNVLEECVLMPCADVAIKSLKDEGDTICFVTARLMDVEGCDTERITKESLSKYNVPYDSLHLHINDKVTFFRDNNIELCIEDSYDTCRKLTDIGIKSILITTKMNEKIDSKEIVRANTWKEVYDEVEKYKKSLMTI